MHAIDNSAIRHNQKNHGNPEKEAKKGQIAIVEDDYQLIPDILEDYDTVRKSDKTNKVGNEVVVYTKEYPDGTIYYLEEIRTGRESLAFDTMYKKKKGIDSSDGLMNNSSPFTPKTTPDNLNSKGKDTTDSSNVQENGKKLPKGVASSVSR